MPRLTLNVEALEVESFPIQPILEPSSRPTTTGMNTNEPGCTLPQLCVTTVTG